MSGWEGGQSDLLPSWHPGELRSPQDSSDRPSSNLRVSWWTLGMGGL